MKTSYTLEELKKATEKYDEIMGRYPESKYEGNEFYDWLVTVNDCEWFMEIFKEDFKCPNNSMACPKGYACDACPYNEELK
jgi:hypothetical protein